ncbi:MAG: thiol peroxidase [Halobacteriovoraceae bacterium]|jgi:thioredoxin-dependent peroxiredoxin|nr:thiol peroxidase [Halobacteriovoraceae bacterium]MBT5092625.1 thiol peroxidase [Halobacteriovoraceae bacterium]
MASITLKGNPINTLGTIPAKGDSAPAFSLVANDLSEATLETFAGKKKVLNIFPSVDTPTCATSIRTFNKNAAEMGNTAVLNISLDLPFAQKRFCGAEGIDHVQTLSAFRSTFLEDYSLKIVDGPLKGLCSRVIIVLGENNEVLHSEQVSEIADEPNYQNVLAALK